MHEIAKAKGWWDKPRTFAELSMLQVCEIAEGVEAARAGSPPSPNIPDFPHEAEEMADAIIRILDAAEYYGYDMQAAISAKVKFNKSRPYRHGKKF